MLRALTRAAVLALLAACRTARAPESLAPIPDPRFAPLVTYLQSQVDSAFPGAVVAVGQHGRLLLLQAVGHYGVTDLRPVDPGTIYDLASLTKVIGLTTACMLLVDEGRLDLDAPVQTYVAAFRGPGKERVTVRHLLTHSSGLPAWRPLYKEAGDRAAALALVDTTALLRAPGDTFVYSDLGAVVLTQAVEAITGERIDRFLAGRVFQPLGMTATRYLPPASWRPRIAPTETDTAFRHRALWGEVHDENAGRLGGVSGHAGLFSSASDLARFASWLLLARKPPSHTCGTDRQPLLCFDSVPGPVTSSPGLFGPIVLEFTHRQDIPAGSSRALGWDTPSENSSAGTKLSVNAFGHTGFTGTSIWLDPDRDLFILLLTNRVHPTRANTRIVGVRKRVADMVVEALAP